MTDEFEAAVDKVLRDVRLDDGAGADLVAVGIKREDVLEFVEQMLTNEPEPLSAEFIAVLAQFCTAVGAWVERARWERLMEIQGL
jgi:hypothetical protein